MVLGPAEDGGYWLVGQRAPGWTIFDRIPWSSPLTLRETRRRLRALELDWHELETLVDVDEGVDLDRVLAAPGHTPPELLRLIEELQKGLRDDATPS